jgi:SAM-dependent methyltransferase
VTPPDLTRTTACRACGGGLELVLDLGATPLANALLPAEGSAGPPTEYPLTLRRCPVCTLVQLGEVVGPERLFSDYVYFSSFSDTMLHHAEAMASDLIAAEGLGRDSLVVELASNDGYLLQYFKERGVPVLGIEPAQNVAAVAERERGIPTIARFFGVELAAELAAEGRRADVIIGNNVLAHVPGLTGFVRGAAIALKPSGLAVFEVPYLGEMIDKVEFDTVYHEHQCYFSATALAALFASQGLPIYDLEPVAIHGGSIRVFAAPSGARRPTERMQALLREEQEWGVGTAEPYVEFAGRVRVLKRALVELLARLKGEGRRIAAYGAAAKGVTLLSYCGVGAGTLDFVVDRSTVKQGRRYPVGGLPILAPSALLERRPDFALLLTWNFAAEILRQQAAYREAGGRFIVPVPAPRVVA